MFLLVDDHPDPFHLAATLAHRVVRLVRDLHPRQIHRQVGADGDLLGTRGLADCFEFYLDRAEILVDGFLKQAAL